jgi:hypothetical protein
MGLILRVQPAQHLTALGIDEMDLREIPVDLTRFCGHFSVTQRGIQDVEIKTEIYA